MCCKYVFLHFQEICVLVGLILHYIFMAAFVWMAVEGHHLYLKLVKVFDSGISYSRIYLITGYGLPLVIVAVTGLVTECLQDRGYANHDL
jgi:7 transmembrane receptor (Secretin family)